MSFNVESIDIIICCRACYGLRHDSPSLFLVARRKSAIACIHDRAQNASIKDSTLSYAKRASCAQ